MKRIATAFILACMASSVNAEDFFSTKESDTFLDFGVRVGVNTSNRTIGKEAYTGYNHEGWGTGFDLGVVADINIRNYLSIQPGIFFESRSNSYTLITNIPINDNSWTMLTQAGNFNSYHFTIPIMGCMHFNITDDLRWDVEAGPYISLRLGSKLKNKVCNYNPDPSIGNGTAEDRFADNVFRQKSKGCDFGIKMGTGLTLFKHYSFAVHYLAGCTHAWKDLKYENLRYSYGGLSKEWTFTLGYNF